MFRVMYPGTAPSVNPRSIIQWDTDLAAGKTVKAACGHKAHVRY